MVQGIANGILIWFSGGEVPKLDTFGDFAMTKCMDQNGENIYLIWYTLNFESVIIYDLL